MNGWKWAGSNTGSVTAMNSASAAILISTRIALSVALSRVPAISRPATTQMMKIAGRLMIPPSSGPWIERVGQAEPDRFQEPRRIARPADRHRADDQRIFEDQRDPDHPRDQLAEHDVGVGVGRSRRGDHRRDLGISERGAGADHAGDGEGEDDGRTRPCPRRRRSGSGCRCRRSRRRRARRDAASDKRLPEPVLLGHVLPRDDRLANIPVLHRLPPRSGACDLAVAAGKRASIILADAHARARAADRRDGREHREPAGHLIFDLVAE